MKYYILGVLFLLTGCFTFRPSPEGFEEKQIQTENFSFAVWEKNTIESGKPFRLYIEGDGNPDPKYQIAKYFASIDESPNVIYTARPCQWNKDKICETEPSIYGANRFDIDVLQEIQELTEYLMRKHHAPSIEVVGYDGGAVVALNLAAKLPVTRIITIAGITDIDAYARYHGIKQSKDHTHFQPYEHIGTLAAIPQIHYVGSADQETPIRLVERFISKMPQPKSAKVLRVPGVDHTNWEGVHLDY